MEQTPIKSVKPVNISIMNVDKFITDKHIQPVTSEFIKETSTNQFNANGLFSEQIFGQIGSTDRLTTFGYIDLHTTILHPIIYRNIFKLKQYYADIMAHNAYAKWNPDNHTFERCGDNDSDADTGMAFFMSHVGELAFDRNNSLQHNEKIDVYEQNLDKLVISKCIVMPAGLRDMRLDEARPSKDSINKLYSSLLIASRSIPAADGNNPVYDGIRFAIQKKVNEIYDYLFELIEGKFGLLQRRYGSRSLALGTRNVISTGDTNAESIDDPRYFQIDELKLPLVQCSHAFMPLVVYWLKQLFFNDIFNISSDQVAVINTKTLALTYQAVTEQEKEQFISTDGIKNILELFRDEDFRFRPVTIMNDDDQQFYLYLIYDDGKDVYLGRNLDDIKFNVQRNGTYFNINKVRPLTYCEMIYVATYQAVYNRTALVTRYPVLEVSSTVPGRVHLFTTKPGRIVYFHTPNPANIKGKMFPEYPVMGKLLSDSMIPHPSLLKGLGADHDGDTVSVDSVLADEANEEVNKYLNSAGRYIRSDGSLYLGDSDLQALMFYNLTRDPQSHLKKK